MSDHRDGRIERLDDYLRGLGPDPDAYEEELFARAIRGDARELAVLESVTEGIRDLASRGTIDPWITAREVDDLRARWGDALVIVDLPDDAYAKVPVPRHAEIVVTRVPVDLRGVERVDVELETLDGRPIKTMPDVRFDPEDGAIYACCEGELARVTVGIPVRSRAWSVGGERRVICEFVSEGVLAG